MKAMLYSRAAIDAVEAIRFGLGRLLSQRALILAKQEGREIVGAEDVRRVLADIDAADLAAVADDAAECS